MDLKQKKPEITDSTMNERFRHNSLFGGIPGEALDGLGIEIAERRFKEGDVVFEEGDEGEHLYLVGEGTILISKKGRGGKQETLTLKKPGEFFGEMTLLDHEPRSARATATEPTLLGKLNRTGLERLLAHSPNASIHFIRTLMRGLRAINSLFIEELLNAERLSLVGTMMSSIVHDIRNPIARIIMVSEWLNSRDDSKLVNKAGMLQRATDRMQTMIEELLDYSRGEIRVNPEPTTVHELIQDLDDEMLSTLPGDKVEVQREIHYDGPIIADRNRIIRLLCNVVKNAEEAMGAGGRLTVRTTRSGNLVNFEIVDTGCGIPAKILDRIFEPFVTHGKTNGTGLGMAIAKSVVEAHRGRIWMESTEGEGTTCHIELPAE